MVADIADSEIKIQEPVNSEDEKTFGEWLAEKRNNVIDLNSLRKELGTILPQGLSEKELYLIVPDEQMPKSKLLLPENSTLDLNKRTYVFGYLLLGTQVEDAIEHGTTKPFKGMGVVLQKHGLIYLSKNIVLAHRSLRLCCVETLYKFK